MMLCLSLLLLGTSASAFEVKSVNPSIIRVEKGHSFEVICTADNWWEFCTFRKGYKSCNIDWKKDPNYNVTMGECDDFAGRVEFRGSYLNFECGLKISGAELSDDGDWSCDIESYVKYGLRGDGRMDSKKFTVYVENPTTTTSTTATTTTTYSSSDQPSYPGLFGIFILLVMPFNM